MILYSLVCEAGHRFDSWFRDSAAFDGSAAHGLVSCPQCRSRKVVKAIMAPAIVARGAPKTSKRSQEPSEEQARSQVDGPASLPEAGTTEPVSSSGRDVALLDDRSRELRALLRSVRDKVVSQGHDVGSRFAAEARRIHDGDAPERQIFGQASVADVRDLLEEGIPILPLPIVPDELN